MAAEKAAEPRLSIVRRRLALLALLAPWAASAGEPAGLVERASAFLALLDEGARDEATWPFEDAERADVHFAPIGLEGVRHGDLERDVYAAGEAVLAAALAPAGHAKVEAIRLLERDVREQESVLRRPLGLRDPGRYFFAFFGAPAHDAPWSMRYEGHHLSLNLTAVPDRGIATTPLFLGAQPREVPAGLPSAGVAALGDEERLARRLYASLDPSQRAVATLPYAEGRGHMLGQVPRIGAATPIGLPREAMRGAQQELLDGLLDRFASFWNAEIAAARREEIAAARTTLHFAHVESDDPANAFYTRISGAGVLLEIDNTEGGDHVHAVWHRPGADFGDDLLTRHVALFHGVSLGSSAGGDGRVRSRGQ